MVEGRKDEDSVAAVTVAVVGAGLVGTLEACLLAQRGYSVDLYEARKDIRTLDHVPGRSINLAMSVRGRSALQRVGVEDAIIAHHAIPMRGRMLHGRDGSTRPIMYHRKGQCIYSVGRRFVNEVLLTRTESFPNVRRHFEHKLKALNIGKTEMTFENPSTKEVLTRRADLVVGCDGAYSAVRKELLKRPHFNYSQQYIEHGYMELCIPATSRGEFAMVANYLHIWPRGQFMMIALPNQDCSWTVTLFMPFHIFEGLSTKQKLLHFFQEYYPDAISLIGRDRLTNDFFLNKASPMISVKCSPYHVGSSCLVLGDAAHAMVPFFGQGMNCGMEDCLVLDELLLEYGNDLAVVLPAFSSKRNPDAEAIVDLAMYNYVEMRDLVNSRLFAIRKKIDNTLNIFFPKSWVPLYTMVTFSREPYHLCVKKKHWQDRVLRAAAALVCCTAVAGLTAAVRTGGAGRCINYVAGAISVNLINVFQKLSIQ